MPFIEVNGARLYYEVSGEDHPGRVPIVLIHGSTMTGQAEWSTLVPFLAREYRVIVPDCRGHGRSSNPNLSYSFAELAADTAGLIHALGYARAHVIGHSNGGNVALVTLVEHPDAVQTCVIQAANAFVSPDLVEKEPPLFDPERVARESPGWRDRMIALHGATHGRGYWRDLLRLTVHAIITEPNYRPEDLARVTRPAFVIQGKNDGVNAPARHAQYMAQHIPFAELWLPAGIGHNVHLDLSLQWVERVLDFLARRGDEANEALYRLRRTRYADRRETVFDVRVEQSAGGPRLTGQVLTSEQYAAALAALPEPPAADDIHVLLDDATPWALGVRNVVPVRRGPQHLAEQVNQLLVGEAVRILEERDGFARVRVERDGYLGWMPLGGLKRCSADDVAAWRAACDMLVLAPLAQAYAAPPRRGAEPVVGLLPFGVALPVTDRQGKYAAVRLPDGGAWWVAQQDLLPLASQPRPDAAGVEFTLDLIRRYVGVPYLWGGCSPFGYDCSGLSQAFLGFMGVAAPRDASQQARAGRPVTETPRPGDLLFFGEPVDDDAGRVYSGGRQAITHVAISLGDDEIIHANGTAAGISYNSLNPDKPGYRAWLREHLAGVRRYTEIRD